MGVEPEDIILVKRCQEGSEEAFREIVEKYQKRTYWIAFSLLNDYDMAQDMSQEAFLRVFKSIKQFDSNKSFYTWLYQIVVNLCIDYIRKEKKVREINAFEGNIDAPDRSKNPSDIIEKNETKELIRQLLDRLPLKYKVVLSLRDIHGFTAEDISEIVGCETATVRWRLHRARRLFRYIWKTRVKKGKPTSTTKIDIDI